MKIIYKNLALTILALSTCFTGGCDLAGIDLNAKPANKDALSDISRWKVTAQSARCEFKNLNAMLDKNKTTYMYTVGDYKNASIIIDLSRPCVFNEILLLHGPKQLGYAGLIEVYTSSNGQDFTKIRTFPGTRYCTYLTLLTQVKARYIKLRAVRTTRYPWTISNIYIQ